MIGRFYCCRSQKTENGTRDNNNIVKYTFELKKNTENEIIFCVTNNGQSQFEQINIANKFTILNHCTCVQKNSFLIFEFYRDQKTIEMRLYDSPFFSFWSMSLYTCRIMLHSTCVKTLRSRSKKKKNKNLFSLPHPRHWRNKWFQTGRTNANTQK